MLLRFLRFLRGYVRFTVSGRYPERFINITARRGVRLWDVLRGEGGFSACMYRADYLRIRPLARGAGVRLRLTAKSGLPEYAARYRDRVGVMIGACAFLMTVFVMSQFIWSVDVTGLETLSRSEMLSILRDQGLYVGAFKPTVNAQEIARSVLLEHTEVGWMAVNLTGSYASVEVKEESPAPDVPDHSTPCNVKARSDGRILRIEAGEGKTVIAEGSGVIAGQLIVSGVVDSEQSGARLVHAQARVIAETQHEASFSVPEVLTGFAPDGETAQRQYALLFGLRLPYRFGAVHSPASVEISHAQAPAPLGVSLPVRCVTESVYALAPYERKLDQNSAEELLKQQSALYECFSLSECRVTGRRYSLTRKDDCYTLHAVYTCEEDIALEEPIGVEE